MIRLLFFIAALAAPSSAQSQAASDFDGNGVVDFGDFLAFASAFGSTESAFDLDGSGRVDFADFLQFASDYAEGPRRPHWILVTPTTSPSGRRDHTLTMDERRRKLVLFGGKRDSVLADTWILELSPVRWRQVVRSRSPGGRRGHTAVYDPGGDRVIVFGGETDSGFLNDVWAFDLDAEVWSFLGVTGDKPLTRYGLGAVMDGTRGRMLISHGFSSDGRYDDTWSFDLATQRWQELTPSGSDLPQARCLHAMAVDSDETFAYLYGGCSSGIGPCPRDDFWSYDLAQQRWSEIVPPGSRPGERGNPTLTFDSVRSRLVLFAGAGQRGTQDVWVYDPVQATWSELDPTGNLPPLRWSHAAVFDARRSRLIVFGGTDGGVWHDDLWELQF